MAFKDVFEETRKKMNNYFGLAQPGLGTFGKQVSSVVRPTVNFVKQNPTPADFAVRGLRGTNSLKYMPSELRSSAKRTFSREGVGSAAGIREMGKGALRAGVESIRAINQLNPTRVLAPNMWQRENNRWKGIEGRLAPRGNEVQQALNVGTNFGAKMAPYGAVEGAAVKIATKALPRLAMSKAGQFGIRRAADVASGQLLSTPEEIEAMGGGVKGRLKIAGMDIVGGTAMEGAGSVVKPLVKTSNQKINLSRNASKLGKYPDSTKPTQGIGTTYQKGRVEVVSNAEAEFILKNNRKPKPGEIVANNYQYDGKTELRYDDEGNFVGWDSDNDLFKAKIVQEAPSIGLSTKDIRGDIRKSTSNEDLESLELVKDALRSGDKDAAKSIYNGLSNKNRLPDFDSIVARESKKKFVGSLSENFDQRMNEYQSAMQEYDFMNSIDTGGLRISDVKRILGSRMAQKSDFDITKIDGFDEFAQGFRDALGKPEASGNEILDLIMKTPSQSELAAMKPPSIRLKGGKIPVKQVSKQENVVILKDYTDRYKQLAGQETALDAAKRRFVRTEPKAPLQELGKGNPEAKTLLDVKPKNNVADDMETIVKKTPVEEKVGLLDYVRTPDRVLKKIGLEKEANFIRQRYDKYQRELPAEIDKIANWAKQTSPEENTNIFRYLDGQKVVLSPKEKAIAGDVQEYLSKWADKLKLPEDKRISNYITHIFEKDIKGTEFPDDLAKIIQDKIPGSVYDPFVMERLGKKGYIEDTWRALQAYVKRATRKYNLDPALEVISKKSQDMELSQFNYVKNYIDRVNMRPTGTDTLIDNSLKQIPFIGYRLGVRPVANLSKSARQMVYRGTLGLNVSTALKNLSQGANTYAKLGEKYTTKGYFDLFRNWKSDELEKVGILKDDLIQDKNINFYKTATDKLDKGLFYLFETAEKINRGAAYYGAKAKALSKGLGEKEAVEYGKKIVRDTQFTFGSIDTPPILQSDIGKTLGQFQSFSLKQAEFLTELATNKDWAGLARYVGATLAFIYGIGEMFGMEPKDTIPSFRVGVPPTLETPVTAAKALLGGKDQYGQPLDYKDVLKSGVKFIPGGTQLKKTYEGLRAYNQGASTTEKGLVRYPISKGAGKATKTALFGQYSTDEARKYFDEKRTPLSEAQSEIFKSVGNAKDYYDKVTDDRKAKKDSAKQIEDIKKGKTVSASKGDLFGLSNGKTYSLELDKSFGSREEAQKATDKDAFDKSGKKSELKDGTYFYRKADGDIGTYTEQEYNFKIRNQKIEKAKENKDYSAYKTLAAEKLADIEKQWEEAEGDPLTQAELENDYIDLYQEMQKYAEYGGFEKGKVGKKFTGITLPTATAKIPIRQAKAPAFKNISKTPRIAIKTNKPKMISKSTLANLR